MARRNKTPPRALPDQIALDRDLAVALAVGNAGSTYELVCVHAAGDRDKRPDGRCWWACGEAVTPDQARRVKAALAAFVEAHRDAPPEAVYRQACALRGAAPLDWEAVHLAVRLAFTTFQMSLAPMFDEVDRLAKQAAEAARISEEPADRGIYRRTGRKRRLQKSKTGVGRPLVLSAQPIKEAAE